MINEEVEKSLKILKDGGVLVYPTDTVWGIGVDATNDEAIQKVYDIKRRSNSKSMLILVDSYNMACKYVKVMPDLAAQLWEISDKPLTLVLPGGCNISSLLIPEEGTIAIRITSNEYCRRLISALKKPIVSTSANISGEPSPVHLDEISKQILDSADYVVDKSMEEGATHTPSSIISLGLGGEIKILRN